jgi:hypothetical protein
MHACFGLEGPDDGVLRQQAPACMYVYMYVYACMRIALQGTHLHARRKLGGHHDVAQPVLGHAVHKQLHKHRTGGRIKPSPCLQLLCGIQHAVCRCAALLVAPHCEAVAPTLVRLVPQQRRGRSHFAHCRRVGVRGVPVCMCVCVYVCIYVYICQHVHEFRMGCKCGNFHHECACVCVRATRERTKDACKLVYEYTHTCMHASQYYLQ